jgi:hypothetical protein
MPLNTFNYPLPKPAMHVTGFVHESIVPIRKSASHLAEMVNQLVFGDMVRILDKHYSWYKIKSTHDNYVGWAHSSMIAPVNEAFLSPHMKFWLVGHLIAPMTVVRNNQSSTVYLCKGARFPMMDVSGAEDEHVFKLEGIEYRINNFYLTEPLGRNPVVMNQTATSYVNVPYLWGGKTPFGADCSGFIQMIMRLHGEELPRDSYQQAEVGETITYADREPGDLAFFKNRYGKIGHVGFLLSRDKIIHAHGRVREDIFTKEGIYNIDLKTLTHRTGWLKRIRA